LSLKLWVNSFLILLFFLGFYLIFLNLAQADELSHQAPCTSLETWSFGPVFKKSTPVSLIEEFQFFIQKKTSPVRGFAEALAMRGLANSEETKLFSEYWISRSLLEAGLIEISVGGFNSIVSKEVNGATFPIQLAAMACLERIHDLHGTLLFTEKAVGRLPSYFRQKLVTQEQSQILSEAALQLFLILLEKSSSPESLRAVLHYLPENSPYYAYAQALFFTRTAQYLEALRQFKTLFSFKSLPANIEKQRDHLLIIQARLEFSMGQYKTSVETYKKVDKRSNELTSSLSGLAWAHLQAENYPEAIGIAVSAQSGWMKQTFVPDPILVSAMALNEICRFPESLRMIELFKREYKSPYLWLKDFHDNKTKPALYPLAIQFLKEGKTQAPHRVVSEWIRSPIFISHQSANHLIFEQKKSIQNWTKLGQEEQRSQIVRLLEKTKNLRTRYKLAKINLQPGEELPVKLIDEFQDLKKQVTHYRRLTRSAGIWNKILKSSNQRVLHLQQEWTRRMESEMALMNQRMYDHLQSSLDNIELIEVEIHNSAGDDIIQQNAQDGGRKPASIHKKDKSNDPSKSSGEVYSWGGTMSTLSGSGEIWEDELDSIKANLSSQCNQ
jgi:tetratricopeptide (TPR) repeat protein